MSFIEGCAVTLAEIAKAAGWPVAEIEAEARRLQVFIGSDWAGRAAVSTVDAHGLASGALERDTEHQRRHTAWVNAHADWERDKEAVRREAFQENYDEFRRIGRSNSEASDRATVPVQLLWLTLRPLILSPGLRRNRRRGLCLAG